MRHHRVVAVTGVCLVVWAIVYRIVRLPKWRRRGWEPSAVWRRLPMSLSIWAGVALLLASLADAERPQRAAVYLGLAVTVLLFVFSVRLRGLASDTHGVFSSAPPDAVELLDDPASRSRIREVRMIADEVSGQNPEFQRILRSTFDRIEAGEASEFLRQGERANRFIGRLARWTPLATAAAASATCGSLIWLLRS